MKVQAMSSELLYLSNADIQEMTISPREAREALLACFRDNALGRNIGLPKSAISIGHDVGSWFLSTSSASEANSIAAMKWVGVVEGNQTTPRVNGLVCVSDYKTGAPVAVLDANSITLIRTAAMSTAAALYLAPETPRTIALVGCGLQALSHLEAFRDLFPTLRNISLLSRSVGSAERIAAAASEMRLNAVIAKTPDELLSEADIVVSMVPSSPGLKSFLDARLLPDSSFVAAIDGSRSWRSETLTAFDRLVTDSLEQDKSPVDESQRHVDSVSYQDDLVHLALHPPGSRAPLRALFSFRGFVIADLALADLVIRKARALGIGTILPR
ncbi:alanine dehydrogenase [Bradyrhizobium sp. LB14.3]|uniref:ornithine cyclodeaminase family protein n=1 Tax=Bradyrhizobium sp. LB14.3 TaxID=3156328 RepID=UPI0033988709